MNFDMTVLLIGLLMIVIGCYGLIRTCNMLKIIISLEIAMKAITAFLILGGYMTGEMALAQSFSITVIVLEVVVAVVAAGIAINLQKKYGNMNIGNLRRLKG